MVEVTKLPDFDWITQRHGPDFARSDSRRAETGPMQFGDDWPGIFIRGDEALSYVDIIAFVLAELSRKMKDEGKDPLDLQKHGLYGLGKLLASCSVGDTGWPPRRLGNVAESQGDQKAIEELPPTDGSKAV